MGAYTRHDRAEIAADFDRVFSLFPRLQERRSQSAGTLSGGEQQMLAIGRALMGRPKLLLLDEPSMGLAPILVEQIFAIIQDINSQGTTILLVEQNAQMALQVASRGYILQTGKIVLADTSAALARTSRSRRHTSAGSRPGQLPRIGRPRGRCAPRGLVEPAAALLKDLEHAACEQHQADGREPEADASLRWPRQELLLCQADQTQDIAKQERCE